MPCDFESLRQRIRTAGELEACFRFGLEREALRVAEDGTLSQAPHPKVFGDKLTNRHITTDYAENQLEFVTGVHRSTASALVELRQIMAWSQQQLPHELLWPLSMPPDLASEDEIPIARYGDSPEGKEKELYRLGLAHRYGKAIQIVSGVHFNFSATDTFWGLMEAEPNERYMAVARNFLRLRYLLVYAYGASPVAGQGYPHVEELEDYCPVSIRMSRFGYSNAGQRGFVASFDSVKEYVRDLRWACTTPQPDYADIPEQLNANILQSPTEYYAPLRIKPAENTSGDLLQDLEADGIGRLEFRSLDVSPFAITGVEQEQLDVMFILLLHCLCAESPPLQDPERSCVNRMQAKVALCGRTPDIKIECGKHTLSIHRACRELSNELREIAGWLDTLYNHNHYRKSLQRYCQKIEGRKILAEQIVQDMEKAQQNHQQFGVRFAQDYALQLRGVSVSPKLRKELE